MITSKLESSPEDFAQSMFVLTGLSLFIHFCEGVAEEHSPAPVIVVGVAAFHARHNSWPPASSHSPWDASTLSHREPKQSVSEVA